ncbi:hypothetical protein BJ875DRAFT_377130 [Amylocarpus encephaloides]|uniref:Zn(2)-C6 fungal-type domain-containing protein n=1 Tax=Amylocarpus encephaloides TaxID=45428 RepID=A0A9P7YJI9_9HELO|nr:hypothetical protein BJ875DRAFT_377130 [Amylocarpus encephaloides]
MLVKDKIVKHRACDECRTRKLACSKDPDSCERCKREKIKCHYSEQKPMGRPRKRQFIETQEGLMPDSTVESLDLGPLPFDMNDYQYDDMAPAQPYYTNTSMLGMPPEGHQPGKMAATEYGKSLWHFGDGEMLGVAPINFDDNLNYDTIDPSLDRVPQLLTTSDKSTSPESGNSPPQDISAPLLPCSCLASMYLALASLQQLPTDIVQALSTVRGAGQTAARTIWCPQCGAVMVEKKMPMIDGFQNIMLLGTLLPIIVHGYHKLLQMIDDEMNAALAAGATKSFRFHDYGGLCQVQQTIKGEMACLEKEMMFKPVDMPPMQWRNTIRALLRVDIYGHEHAGFKHKGLKGLVEEIEQRQIARHKWLDTLPPEQLEELHAEAPFTSRRTCLGEQTHGCIQILEMAKKSLSNLVIA